MDKLTSKSLHLIAPAACLALLTACSPADKASDGAESGANWPTGLAPPINGATFSLSDAHLPGAPREHRSGTHQGFDFSNGSSGRPLPPNAMVVAVATGEIIRIDREYTAPPAEALRYWAEIADSPGDVGRYALDQLRGRQVWIRHEGGHVSRYAHLSSLNSELAPGDTVEQGQPLGQTGNSGMPPTEEQPEPTPHLHFELWSANGSRYLGKDLGMFETHRLISRVFGTEALPRFARQAVADVANGEPAPDPYPPEPIPETGFNANPPTEASAGRAFAASITWEGDAFHTEDFFATLEGAPLGIIDAGNGAWILGGIPIGVEAETVRLNIGAIDPYGQTLLGQRSIQVAPASPETPPPMEVAPRILDQHTQQHLQTESERLGTASLGSMQRYEPLWDSAFQAPLIDGNIVGEFGQKLVAGPLTPAFPRPGFLIKPSGDNREALASNSGIVALVADLPVRGRTVVIDHGGGVISVYGHLSETRVEADDRISKGQAIGTIGQTGALETEALRWEMHVAGIPVDPRSWLNQIIPGR
jgi:murein DD-endopeptidase MepM/ murein hydrolase activator NlpD